MSFYERYAECCKRLGIQPQSQFAADKMGCTKSAITAFARNQTTPKGEIIAGAAKMLNVSADYLLGLVDNPIPISENFSETEASFLSIIKELNPNGLQAAESMLYGLSQNPIYKKGYNDNVDDKRA